MKVLKKLNLLLMLLTSLMLVTKNTNASELQNPQKNVTCEELLEECAQVVKVQKEALDAVEQERQLRETIIDEQEKEISKLRKQRNKAVGTNLGFLGVALLLLLL